MVAEAIGGPFGSQLRWRAVAAKLNPGERVVYEGRPSWRSIVGFYARGLALTAAGALLAAVASLLAGGEADRSLVLLVALAGVGYTVLAGFLKRAASAYTVTDRRLRIRRGILSRTVQELRLDQVRSVNCRQTPAQRLLGVGDVEVGVAPDEKAGLSFIGVASPARVARAIADAGGVEQRPR